MAYQYPDATLKVVLDNTLPPGNHTIHTVNGQIMRTKEATFIGDTTLFDLRHITIIILGDRRVVLQSRCLMESSCSTSLSTKPKYVACYRPRKPKISALFVIHQLRRTKQKLSKWRILSWPSTTETRLKKQIEDAKKEQVVD